MLLAQPRPYIYRSELDRPDRRIWAITFVVVHRFQKTRRFSSSLGVAHPPARGAYTACCIFWGRLRAPASHDLSDWEAVARLPLRQPPAERGGCACFSEFLRPSEALRACSCQIFAFSLPRTGFTSRHRSPRDFPSLKSQRRSKPHILAGCSARRSPHQPALRRSTSLYSGGTRPVRRRVVFPSYERN